MNFVGTVAPHRCTRSEKSLMGERGSPRKAPTSRAPSESLQGSRTNLMLVPTQTPEPESLGMGQHVGFKSASLGDCDVKQ